MMEATTRVESVVTVISAESALSDGVSLHGHQSRAPYGSLRDQIQGDCLAEETT